MAEVSGWSAGGAAFGLLDQARRERADDAVVASAPVVCVGPHDDGSAQLGFEHRRSEEPGTTDAGGTGDDERAAASLVGATKASPDGGERRGAPDENGAREISLRDDELLVERRLIDRAETFDDLERARRTRERIEPQELHDQRVERRRNPGRVFGGCGQASCQRSRSVSKSFAG